MTQKLDIRATVFTKNGACLPDPNTFACLLAGVASNRTSGANNRTVWPFSDGCEPEIGGCTSIHENILLEKRQWLAWLLPLFGGAKLTPFDGNQYR